MALPVRLSIPSKDGLAYRHLYSRSTQPLITGAELRELVAGYEVPPCTMRWRFETKFKRKASGNKDVILKHVLEVCQKHKLDPVNISNPGDAGPGQFVDVLFADGDDLMKAWNAQLSFDFYGTQPSIVGRGSKLGSDMVAFEVKTLPVRADLTKFVRMLQEDERLQQAGEIVDVWAMEQASNQRFQGVVLVLLQVNSVGGVPSVSAKMKIPGYFVINEVPYLVKYPGRPGWCKLCRRDGDAPFHSIHACPNSKCLTCGNTDHSSVNCELKRKSRQTDDQDTPAGNQTPTELVAKLEALAVQADTDSSITQAPTPSAQQALSEQVSKEPASEEHATTDAVDGPVAQRRAEKKRARHAKLREKKRIHKQELKEKAAATRAAEAATKDQASEAQASRSQASDVQKSAEQVTPTPERAPKAQLPPKQASKPAAKEQAPKPAVKEQTPKPATKAQSPKTVATAPQPSASAAAKERVPKPAAQEQAPKQVAKEQLVQQAAREQASRAQGSRSQAPTRRQAPENLPKKQLQYIKAMERRLLQLCLEDADADVTKLAQSMGVIALSSDDDDSDF